MIVKRMIWIFNFILICICASAQDVDQLKKQINQVKRSDAYIYSEFTMADEQEAYDAALSQLFERINSYNAKLGKANRENVRDVIKRINHPRGNLHRVFLYVDVTDLGNLEVATTKTMEQVQKPEVGLMVSLRDDVITDLLSYENFDDIRTGLGVLKKQGKIKSYAKYNDLANPNDFILIVFNQQGKVMAVLGEGGEERENMRTHKYESIRNYKGCDAVGVKI